MPEEVEYLTMQQAADELGVSRRRVWDLARTGQIETTQNPLDRREKLIARSEVERLKVYARPKKAAA